MSAPSPAPAGGGIGPPPGLDGLEELLRLDAAAPSPSPAPPAVLSDEERLAAAIKASQATKEEDAARRRAETDALERAAAERFQTLEGEHQAEVARRQAAERAQAEAALAREEREAEQRAGAEAERRRQADVAAAAAAQEQAELQRVIDEEAHKYIKSLGEAGLAAIPPGPSLASDIKKAERYYDKVDSRGLAYEYLDLLRFAAIVSTTLPKHSGWEASPEKAALTKRLMITIKRAEVMKPKIVEMRKEELRRKMGGGA